MAIWSNWLAWYPIGTGGDPLIIHEYLDEWIDKPLGAVDLSTVWYIVHASLYSSIYVQLGNVTKKVAVP